MRNHEVVLRQSYELVKVRFEQFPENAGFLPLPAQRKEHKDMIALLRREHGEKKKEMDKTERELKELEAKLAEFLL